MNLKSKMMLLLLASSITSLAVLVGSFFLIGAIFTTGYTHKDLNLIGTELSTQAEQAVSALNGEAASQEVITFIDNYHQAHPQIEFVWFSQQGSVQYTTNEQKSSYAFNELIDRFVGMPDKMWGEGDEAVFVYKWQFAQSDQYLMLAVPTSAMQETQFFFYVRELWMLIYLFVPLILLMLTPHIFSIFFLNRINRRLKKLNQAMQQFDAQGARNTLEVRGKDEISHLYHYFNHMSDRIREQVIQIQDHERHRQALIANLSHDLRTPLTMIQGYAETLHDGLFQNDEERKKYTQIVLQRSLYMNKLLQKLLAISQLDSNPDQIHFKQVNLSEQLRKLAADYIIILERHGMSFDIRIPDQPILVSIDLQFIQRAIHNLLENAIQYGQSGKYLGLELKVVDETIEIRVSDKGPGIPAEKQEAIFQRFVRGTDAREGEGLGIGLSIVQNIVTLHQGSIRLESKPGEGASFTMVIPLKRLDQNEPEWGSHARKDH